MVKTQTRTQFYGTHPHILFRDLRTYCESDTMLNPIVPNLLLYLPDEKTAKPITNIVFETLAPHLNVATTLVHSPPTTSLTFTNQANARLAANSIQHPAINAKTDKNLALKMPDLY